MGYRLYFPKDPNLEGEARAHAVLSNGRQAAIHASILIPTITEIAGTV